MASSHEKRESIYILRHEVKLDTISEISQVDVHDDWSPLTLIS